MRSFVLAQPRRHLIIQTDDAASLLWLQKRMPWASGCCSSSARRSSTELRTDAHLRAAIDGVSVRNRLATLPLLAGWSTGG